MLTANILDDLIDKELTFGLSFNSTRKDCKWRKPFVDDGFCEDDVKVLLVNDGLEELVSLWANIVN